MSETINHTGYGPTGTTLYLAFELGNAEWKLGFTIGLGQSPRQRKIRAGDLVALQREIDLAKKRFNLAAARVLSCYEAGRDGFWLHRYLVSQEKENLVVDSASIEVNRRARRAKTDRLDVKKLLTMLIRYDSGEQKVWSVVHVPSVEAEDSRQSASTTEGGPDAAYQSAQRAAGGAGGAATGRGRSSGKTGKGTAVGWAAFATGVAVTAGTGVYLLSVCG